MRPKLILRVVLSLAALTVTPVLHHHSFTPSPDGELAASLQTVCAVCLHGKAIAPPEAVTSLRLSPLEGVEVAPIIGISTFESVLAPSRAPPAIA